jgi:integrase
MRIRGDEVSKAVSKRMRLTDLSVGRINLPASGNIIWWDTLVVGLGIRISHTGSRTWIIAVRRPGKNPVRLRFGRFPSMKVAEARAKARDLIAGGGQPATVAGFTQIAEQFLAHRRTRKGRELRQNSVDQYRRAFARYARPLHQRPFAEITRRDVAGVIRDVANESGATTASLVRAMLHRLWSYAIEVGEVEYNVVTGTPGYEVRKRSRVLMDGEIATIWAATEDRSEFGLIMRMLLWTGARRSEVGGMRWSEITGSTGEPLIWTVPGSRTKNHRDLILPLPHQAVAALQAWPRVVGQDTLFGTRNSSGFGNWSNAKRRLDARLGFAQSWDLHDIRRTVETRLVGLGVPKDHVNRLLNHAQDPIGEAYNRHEYLHEKELALKRWAAELDRITAGDRAKVILLRSAV